MGKDSAFYVAGKQEIPSSGESPRNSVPMEKGKKESSKDVLAIPYSEMFQHFPWEEDAKFAQDFRDFVWNFEQRAAKGNENVLNSA